MAGAGVRWIVVQDLTRPTVAAMDARAQQIVRATALAIQGDAQDRAPVDTGFLRSSIQAQQIGPTAWAVTVTADYGIYVEMGTVRMAAQPFFQPAIEANRQAFIDAMKRVIT